MHCDVPDRQGAAVRGCCVTLMVGVSGSLVDEVVGCSVDGSSIGGT